MNDAQTSLPRFVLAAALLLGVALYPAAGAAQPQPGDPPEVAAPGEPGLGDPSTLR